MKRRGAVLLFAVAAAVGLYGVPAGATGSHRSHDDAHGHVLVVDKTAHHHRTCYGKYHRVFRTIQRAVTARLRDATGRWRGPESIVQGTPGANGPGGVQLRANDITWDGFTIRGSPRSRTAPACTPARRPPGT
jgi:hypothetical protein